MKLAVATGSRSEYGVLRPFLRRACAHPGIGLSLLVSGMHLSPRHGETIREVEADGVPLAGRVPMLPEDDSPAEAARALGRGVEGFARLLSGLRPDALLVEGDRIEALAAALAAGYLGLPLIHSGGGDSTGTVDDAARHAISLFASLHFVSTEAAKERLLRFGRPADTIFVVGGLGIDAIREAEAWPREKLLAALGLPPGSRYLLVASHPDSAEGEKNGTRMAALLRAVAAEPLRLVLTYPNNDPGSQAMIGAIDAFGSEHSDRVHVFAHLGQERYLNALRHCEALVGNSSSGLYEAPTFCVPAVNVGARQKGRILAENVLSCAADEASIRAALATALRDENFRARAEAAVNPYGDGHAAERMVRILAERFAP